VNLDCLTYAGHLENLEGAPKNPKYLFEQVDLRDKPAVLEVVRKHEITHVMHLAAESHVDRSITGPGDFIHTNVVGTFNLLEACRSCWLGRTPTQGNRFLHVSTDEVYGSLGSTGYFTESTPYAPNSPYSASKASSDLLVRAYHHTYGLPTLITNCSNNYGPFQFPEKLIPVVIQSVLARKPVPVYGDGMNVRDWLYVRDHAEALWLVLKQGELGETYNIGGHNEWANIRIVELICDLIDELAPKLGGGSRKLIAFVKDRPDTTGVTPLMPGRSSASWGGCRPTRSNKASAKQSLVPGTSALGRRGPEEIALMQFTAEITDQQTGPARPGRRP